MGNKKSKLKVKKNIPGKKSSGKITKIIFLLSIIFILFCFYKVNKLNYIKHKIIRENIVKHPENLPKKEIAINTSFGFKNLKADIYWLETIQYIGGNALSSEYKRYLFSILDLVTELNPYFEDPYIIGQLLLPSYNERYENITKEEELKYIEQGIEIGLKGIKNFCDKKKMELIKNENNLNKIWTEEKYKNPCKNYSIPYHLAYIYYFYKNDPLQSSLYYKIASANDNSLEGSRIMAAIMQGKGGNREKSYFMLLNIAKFIESQDEVCLNFATELEGVGKRIFINKNMVLDGKLVKLIGENRKKLLGDFSSEDEKDPMYDTKCINYLNKATRELNLKYIEIGNEKYKKDNEGKTAFTAKQLFNKGYIDYLPIDFQQYENYGIIYKYNFDTKNFDYEMGYDDDE